MIISLEDARKLDKDIEEADILALEAAIRSHTNNRFRLKDYKPLFKGVTGNVVSLEAPYNLFTVDDTIEIVGVQFLDGYYIVRDVTRGINGDTITIDLPFEIDMTYEGNDGYIYLLHYDEDIKAGAKDVLIHKLKMAENKGIKSKSISRVTITYDAADTNANLIYGVSSNQFDFLAPHMRMGWM